MNSTMLPWPQFLGTQKARVQKTRTPNETAKRVAHRYTHGRIVAQIGKGNKSLKGLKRSRLERLLLACVDERGNNSGVRF